MNQASFSDHHTRKQLLMNLVSLCASDIHIAGVAKAWCTSLDECAVNQPHVTIKRGDIDYGNLQVFCLYVV